MNFLDGNNQLQELDVLKAAVVFVKCAGYVRAAYLIACASVGPIDIVSGCFLLSNAFGGYS